MKRALLAALLLIVPALPVQAAQRYAACAKYKNFTTQVALNLETPDPVFDNKHSRSEVNSNQQQRHMDWLRKNGMQSVWLANEMQTMGTAAGGWAMVTNVRNQALPYDSYGTSWCPYFSAVEINMIYRTIITIPKEFKPGSCGFNVIYEHEMRHHATNVAIVKTMTDRLRRDMPAIISDIETSTSYLSRLQVNPRFTTMQNDVHEALNFYITQTMQAEMARQNGLIDSPAEYKRATKALQNCDD